MLSRFKNHIILHFIILIFGFTGILGKKISIEPTAIVWHRVFIAFVSLFFIMLILRSSFRVPSRGRFFQIIGIGVVVGLHWVTFFKSVHLSTASFGVLCLSTTTLHVSWIEPLVMKRPFSWGEVGLSLLVVLGIYFVSHNFHGDQLTALYFGLFSALLAAIFSVYNAKFVRDTPAAVISLYEMGGATIAIAGMIAFSGNLNATLFIMSGEDFFWLTILGTVCTSFAFLMIVIVTKKLGAFTVSLSINLEPVYTLILGILILNENQVLNQRFYIGAVLIVGVVFLNAFIKPSYKSNKTVQDSDKS
jgi:drug/metabolite transporter (DMT)-like permease